MDATTIKTAVYAKYPGTDIDNSVILTSFSYQCNDNSHCPNYSSYVFTHNDYQYTSLEVYVFFVPQTTSHPICNVGYPRFFAILEQISDTSNANDFELDCVTANTAFPLDPISGKVTVNFGDLALYNDIYETGTSLTTSKQSPAENVGLSFNCSDVSKNGIVVSVNTNVGLSCQTRILIEDTTPPSFNNCPTPVTNYLVEGMDCHGASDLTTCKIQLNAKIQPFPDFGLTENCLLKLTYSFPKNSVEVGEIASITARAEDVGGNVAKTTCPYQAEGLRIIMEQGETLISDNCYLFNFTFFHQDTLGGISLLLVPTPGFYYGQFHGYLPSKWYQLTGLDRVSIFAGEAVGTLIQLDGTWSSTGGNNYEIKGYVPIIPAGSYTLVTMAELDDGEAGSVIFGYIYPSVFIAGYEYINIEAPTTRNPLCPGDVIGRK